MKMISGFKTWYSSTTIQVIMIALTCFGTPGLFNALSGIGGGGQVDAKASNDGAVALYSTFAITSFFSGTINNRLGSRLTLGMGASGYAFYILSFLIYNLKQNSEFVIAAGAILGICAGLLWTAQGSLILAYACEESKGKLLALFWAIFNLGGVLGSAIELGLTYDSTSNTVSNTVYAVFLVLSSLSALIPFLLVDPGKMIKSDGTKVLVPLSPSWQSELKGMFNLLLRNNWIILLFPYFFISNFYYTYQFNDYNGALFNLRTRSLNSLCYWFFQILSVGLFGILIDFKKIKRKDRAWLAFLFVFLLSMSVWGGTFSVQLGYTREDIGINLKRIDFKDVGYGKYLILYIWMGISDAIWQNFAYWLMGTFSNSTSTLAYLVGFYKAIQSIGAVIAFKLDSNLFPYLNTVILNWSISLGALVLLGIVLSMGKVGDYTIEENLMRGLGRENEEEKGEEGEKNDSLESIESVEIVNSIEGNKKKEEEEEVEKDSSRIV